MHPLYNESGGLWYCGTFISMTEGLHNMPLSIHRYADKKKRKKQEAKRWTKWSISTPAALSSISRLFFITAQRFVSEGFILPLRSHLLTVDKVAALAVAGCPPVSFTWFWQREAEGNPTQVTFSQSCLHSPHFTPKTNKFGPAHRFGWNDFAIARLCHLKREGFLGWESSQWRAEDKDFPFPSGVTLCTMPLYLASIFSIISCKNMMKD